LADFSKGSDGWELFNLYFKLCKKFANPRDEDEWFSEMCSDFDSFTEKFKSTEFSEFATMLAVDYMEWQGKECEKKYGKHWWIRD
jgi:hypothetical protein